MKHSLSLAELGRASSRCALGALLAGGLLASGQTLPPGSLPPGPPPAPGQLGPPPEKLPPDTDRSITIPAKNTPAAGSTSSDPKGADVIRVETRSVLVPTTVLDPDGHGYVNGLQPSEFELTDNSKPQKITSEAVQLPMSVVLAIQANSEVEPVLPTLRKAGVLLQGLVTGRNNDIAVIAFDHRIQHLQDFTADPAKLDDAMQKLTAGSSSARVIDAVGAADQMLVNHDPNRNRRRVIVLVSRNLDKGSEGRLQETARRMQFDNVIVYCVDISRAYTALMKKPDYPRPAMGGIPPEAQGNIAGGIPRTETTNVQQEDGNVLNGVPPIYNGIRNLFRKSPAEAFAQFTGGRMYNFAKQRGLEAAISDIGADLNSQYLLSYTPNDSDEPGFHTIVVKVNRPGLYVHTRPGYWTGGGKYQ